mmetsp:Transcript_11558/g.19442  ORF Transcript_11558/g.19442 Transcript_11558/m.19442 type:complete len:157 (-) Transcript_11558:89-559(-)
MRYILRLQLRTIIQLSCEEPILEFKNWVDEQQIQLINLGADVSKLSAWKPVSEEVVVSGLQMLLDSANYPLLVTCNLGRHRTGTIIGCMRKLQRWNLTCILEEYRRHAGSKFRLLNEQFIELFDVDLVNVPPKCPPWFCPSPSQSSQRTQMRTEAM